MKRTPSATPPSADPSALEAPVSLSASADRYLASLTEQRQLSRHTVIAYRRELETLWRFASNETQPLAIEALRAPQIRRFAAKLHARGLGPRSIARALSAWRGYYTWLAQCAQCAQFEQAAAVATDNPVADVHAPKIGKRLPKALSEDLTMRLLDAAHSAPHARAQKDRQGNDQAEPDLLARRDAAIFELFYSSGLRLSELVGLDIAYAKELGYLSSGWIDLASCEVTVTGKGNKRRTVPVGSKARDAIATWLAGRDRLVKADPHPLFLSSRGARLSGRTIQSRLKAHAVHAGIPAHVHPHVLRHSFASHMLQASGDLRAVQELLGHTSIAATQVYTSLDFKRLAEVYDAAHPRARRK